MDSVEEDINSSGNIPNISEIKYGDADVSSKRRKLQIIDSEKETIETDSFVAKETNVKTDDFYTKFEKDVIQNCLQSSFRDIGKSDIEEASSIPPNVSNSKERYSSTRNIETCAKSFSTITDKPSVSSKGFENSFKLLQHQIQSKTIKLSTSSLLSSSCTLLNNVECGDEPSLLEIELEAMRRIKLFVHKLETEEKLDNISMPLLALCYTFVSRRDNQDIFCGSASGDQSVTLIKHINDGLDIDLKYHVGKDTDGSKCLKIVRHLLKQKGNCLHFLKCGY